MWHRIESAREWWGALWEATQVELQGHYTIANLQEFEQYHARASWLRALFVCLLTPLPCLLVLVLTDLLPLESPTLGPDHSPNVWIRTTLTVTQITFCILQQFRQHLPELTLWYWIMAVISVAAAASSVAFCFAMAHAIGYPVPFHMVLGTLPWGFAVVVVLLVFRGHTLANNRELTKSVAKYLLVFICQIAMTVVYPVFNYIYSKLSSTRQTGFILLLPIIKIMAKNWIGRTLPDSDDAKPEAIVFNVEIFHALFVSLCMGSTTSPRTVLALMLIDFLQAWLSFADIRCLLADLELIAAKLARARERTDSQGALSTKGLEGLLTLTNRVIEIEPFQARTGRKSRSHTPISRRFSSALSSVRGVARHAIQRIHDRLSRGSRVVATITPSTPPPRISKTGSTLSNGTLSFGFGGPLKMNAVVPERGPPADGLVIPSDLAVLNVVERGVLVRQTQKVLFVTEFIVLIEYTEVIMPWIYSMYVVATWYLPNRAYYPVLDGIDSGDDLIPMIFNVQLYAALEFVSLITMASIVWWKLRISLLHQLAYVLEKRAANVQAKLLLWVLYTMQTSIVQLGVDYSFRFAWLRTSTPHT